MRDLLEKKFFPFVIKPGRYTGGEQGQIVKDPANRTSYLHIYPDKYEIGQSHVGLQIIYQIVNRDDRFLCERAYAVDFDAEKIMRDEEISFFSLESARPAANFDLVGFSLVDETVYSNLLNILDLSKIPLRSKDRNDSHPLIIAGGPAVFNPEPIAPFIDLFYIGDAEEGLPELLGVVHEMRGATRIEKLEAICRKVPSIYIPAFYDDTRKPINDFAPEKIVPRVIEELKPEFYPDQPIVPLIETVQSHLAVEIMRGCPQGCRFCMARAVYKPTRIRPKEDIVRQIERQIDATGYNEVTLLSLSSADYPDIESLAVPLARSLEARKVSITLPSLRPGSISPALLDAVKRVRRFGLTIAPEAGTERLRAFLRKDISDQAIFDTVRMAFEKGWNTVKLYFMVGLPSETDEDLQGIVDICDKIHLIGREYEGKKTINVTLSPFVPKPHTPFQWDEALSEEETFSRITRIKRQVRSNRATIKHNSTQLAELIAVVSRGSRQMADAIEYAFKAGARFDGWGESFEWELWKEAFAQNGIDRERSLIAIPFSADLPWSHIAKGANAEFLQKERQRTSTRLREYSAPSSIPNTAAEKAQPTMEFGRARKKLAARNRLAPTKNRIRVQWGKTSRCRFLGHLDNIHMFEMALRRANLPVEFSQGFNPSPRLSFGPPLPLGMTSESECADILLTESPSPAMIDRLKRAMAEGFFIAETRAVLGNAPSLSSRLNRVDYHLNCDVFDDPARLPDTIDQLMAATSFVVEREGKREVKQLDIRSAIHELRIENGLMELKLGMGESGYAKPGEVMSFFADNLKVPVEALLFHRKRMYRVENDNRVIDALEL